MPKKINELKPQLNDDLNLRFEEELRWQFKPASKILGISLSELMRRSMRLFIANWHDEAPKAARVAARKIVKKALSRIGATTNPAKVKAKIEKLKKHDFYAEIKRHLRAKKLKPISDDRDFDKLADVGREYFAKLKAKPRVAAKELEKTQEQLIQLMAEEILYSIRYTLDEYRTLEESRTRVQQTPYYQQLTDEQKNEPWTLAAIVVYDEIVTGKRSSPFFMSSLPPRPF